MLNKLRQQSWYYAAAATCAGIVIAAGVYAQAILFNKTDALAGFSLTPISLVTGALELIIGFLIGGPFLDRLPKRKERGLRWLVKQPLMWQFTLFIFTAVVAIGIVALLHANVTNALIAALDIGLNISYTTVSLYFLYWFCRVAFYKNK